MSARSLSRTISQDQIGAYAAASGDHNAIHVDPVFAASSPFEGTIAHGMLVLALAAELMHEKLGDAWVTRGRLKMRFKAPTRPGDTVSVTASTQSDDYAVTVTNQRGDTLLEGRAGLREPG